MTEDGMLSIVRRETTYQVHYASANPHGLDRSPYPCSDEDTLVTVLHHYGMDAWSIQQARTELQRGRVAVLSLVCTPAQLQTYFPSALPVTQSLAVAAA